MFVVKSFFLKPQINRPDMQFLTLMFLYQVHLGHIEVKHSELNDDPSQNMVGSF